MTHSSIPIAHIDGSESTLTATVMRDAGQVPRWYMQSAATTAALLSGPLD
jgi:hypothetical protein